MSELSEHDVESVRDIIRRSNLRAVEFHEYGGRQHVVDRDPVEDADLSVSIQHRGDEDDFGVRLVVQVEDHRGVIDVTVAAEYEVTEGEVPSGRPLQLFAHEVGVMALYPYVREAVDTIATRLFRAPLLLPVIERGTFALQENQGESADLA